MSPSEKGSAELGGSSRSASDRTAFPYLIEIESRQDESGRWVRHVECPDDLALFGMSESLTEAFAQLDRRYHERADG